MTGEAASLLAHERIMLVRDVLLLWAPETDAHPAFIKNFVMRAIANGELDGTDEQPGLFIVDTLSGIPSNTRGKELMASLSKHERGAIEALSLLIDMEQIAVSRESFQAFCRARNMPPPSFWAAAAQVAQRNGKADGITAPKASTQPHQTKRHSGGAPPTLKDAILAWFPDQPPEIKGLNNSKLASQFLETHKGDLRSTTETIRKLRVAGHVERASN